jgi:hypothetical protein
MAKDLMDWAPKEAPAASESEDEPEPEKPDLGEKRLRYLAEETGVENPGALVKLVKACIKECGAGKPAPTDEE